MFIRKMVENNKPLLTENEKIALVMNNAGDGQGLIMDMSGKTADEVMKDEMVNKFNDQVDMYVEKFNEHSKNLEKYVDNISKNVEEIEIMPLGNYVLIKEFEQNPFQRIVRDSSGLITDLGGMKPIFKNTDNGEIEEEEQFIKVGVVQEVGPECKYLQPGDAVFYSKPSAIPVPFYKQKLIQVNETRVLAVVNDSLTERFNKIKEDNDE